MSNHSTFIPSPQFEKVDLLVQTALNASQDNALQAACIVFSAYRGILNLIFDTPEVLGMTEEQRVELYDRTMRSIHDAHQVIVQESERALQMGYDPSAKRTVN